MNPAPGPLRLTRTDTGTDTGMGTGTGTGTAIRIELHGDFDHHNADALLDAVTEALAEPGRTRDLHVDCAGVSAVDSSGLSTLLMARRATDAAGVQLHLHNRPAKLDRMLQITGTLEHLTGHSDSGRPSTAAPGRISATAAPVPARSGGPEAVT